MPVRYVGSVPDPFREGREIVIDVRKEGATFVGPAGLARDEVPVEVHGRAEDLTEPCRPPARACLILALAICLYGIGASLYGARTGRRESSPPAAAPSTRSPGVLVVAMAILQAAFVRSDFSFALVASHSSTTTPLFYRLTAVWSSQEGSLLLWVLLLSLWSSAILFLTRRRLREVAPYATAVLLGFGAFFCGLLVFLESPFTTLAAPPAEGVGPQPAAAPPEHDDPPADALLGLHAVRGAVRVRDRRAGHAAARRGVDPRARARSRSPPGCCSAWGSCSARAGRTPSWAGAATGPGTRSRTRR